MVVNAPSAKREAQEALWKGALHDPSLLNILLEYSITP